MNPPSPSELRNLLTFLKEVGYGDVIVPVEQAGARNETSSAARRGRRRQEVSPNAQPPASRPPSRRPPAPGRAAARSPAARPPSRPAEPHRPAPPPAQAHRGQAPLSSTDSPQARWERLDELRQHALSCMQCALSKTRNKVVFASGDPNADLMFIGEGPGADEDRQGIPFVGEAGQLLNKIIAAIDMRREEIYVANIVKCRPPGNRNPYPVEVQECRGFLDRQIDLVQPRLIVLLGKVASESLLGPGPRNTLKEMRGRWHTYRGVPVRVTYHPAALLRNRGFKRPTWEDMQIVRDELKRLRSAQ